MAVKRITYLSAQGIARAQARWLQAIGVAGCKNGVPDGFDDCGGRDNLESVLPGVPGAGQIKRFSREMKNGELVLAQISGTIHACSAACRTGKTGVNEPHRPRTLQGESAKFVRRIFEGHVHALRPQGELLLHPADVCFNARGIHHQQELVLSGAVSI